MKIIYKFIKACAYLICIFILSYELINTIEENYGKGSVTSKLNSIQENVREIIHNNDKKDKGEKNKKTKKSDKDIKAFKKYNKEIFINEFSEPVKKLYVGKESSVTLKASDKSQLMYQIYRGLLFRKESIVIEYDGRDIEYISRNIKEITDDILKKFDNVKTSNDFDYLDNDIKSMRFNTTWNVIQGKISISVVYLDNEDQQSYVDGRVKGIIKQLKLKKKSDYQKIKRIHDWITDNIKYDYSKQNYSAYAGLRYGKTVCQGYAMLTYKMLTEAGINCRIISGKANNGEMIESHAWNLVQLDDKWYYIDTTWNDGTSSYKYFLIGEKQMKRDHFSAARYNKSDFRKYYNISNSNY